MGTANVIVRLFVKNCISPIIWFPLESTTVTRGIKEKEWDMDTLFVFVKSVTIWVVPPLGLYMGIAMVQSIFLFENKIHVCRSRLGRKIYLSLFTGLLGVILNDTIHGLGERVGSWGRCVGSLI